MLKLISYFNTIKLWLQKVLSRKKIRGMALVCFAVVFCVAAKYSDYEKKTVDITGDKQLSALTVRVLKTLAKQDSDKNYLISVQNLYQGLAILANGAEGATLDKLKMILGSSSLDESNLKSKEMIEHYLKAFKFDNELSVAKNSLDKSFKSILDKYFDMSFDDGDRECAMQITSLLKFSSLWENDYEKTDGEFYTSTGVVQVPMFEGTHDVLVAEGNGFKVYALRYKSGDIFYILLPDEVKGEDKGSSEVLKNIVENLDAETFHNLHFTSNELYIAVPKFTVTETRNLLDILAEWGLGNIRQVGQAELGKIFDEQYCGRGKEYVRKFEQQNEIIVNESGTEAISEQEILVDFFGIKGGCLDDDCYLPPVVRVDRPFIYMVNNGAFAGIVYDPREK